jgi:septal ring factor EnvC (AmiA/AmiB activator)
LGEDLGQLDAYRREFDNRSAELTRHMREVDEDRRTVEREKAGKEAQLRLVRGRKARAMEAVRELKSSADRLRGMLDGLVGEALRREAQQRREQAEARARERQEAPTSAPGDFDQPVGHFGGRGLRRGLPWPVRGPIVTEFGKHLHPVFHIPVFNRGIEIASEYGSPVRVVAAGLVDFAGELEGFGHLVVVDHGAGMLSVYGYGSRLRVRKGQTVRQGDVLEDVGEAAGSRQPSLYFEIRRGVKAQDPLRFLARR